MRSDDDEISVKLKKLMLKLKLIFKWSSLRCIDTMHDILEGEWNIEKISSSCLENGKRAKCTEARWTIVKLKRMSPWKLLQFQLSTLKWGKKWKIHPKKRRNFYIINRKSLADDKIWNFSFTHFAHAKSALIYGFLWLRFSFTTRQVFFSTFPLVYLLHTRTVGWMSLKLTPTQLDVKLSCSCCVIFLEGWKSFHSHRRLLSLIGLLGSSRHTTWCQQHQLCCDIFCWIH